LIQQQQENYFGNNGPYIWKQVRIEPQKSIWTFICAIHFSLPIVRCFYYSMTTKPLGSYYRMGVLMFSVCRQCFFTIIYPSEILTQNYFGNNGPYIWKQVRIEP
jgi:hypothetical protein